MDPLTGFIIVLIVITFQFTLYAIKRMQEPFEPNFSTDQTFNKMNDSKKSYWKNAEITNGRLAMIGLLALVVNYGFFGWIIPGFIWIKHFLY